MANKQQPEDLTRLTDAERAVVDRAIKITGDLMKDTFILRMNAAQLAQDNGFLPHPGRPVKRQVLGAAQRILDYVEGLGGDLT